LHEHNISDGNRSSVGNSTVFILLLLLLLLVLVSRSAPHLLKISYQDSYRS